MVSVKTFSVIMALITIIFLCVVAIFLMAEFAFEYLTIALLSLIYLELVRKPDMKS